jgi:hypothetical protein
MRGKGFAWGKSEAFTGHSMGLFLVVGSTIQHVLSHIMRPVFTAFLPCFLRVLWPNHRGVVGSPWRPTASRKLRLSGQVLIQPFYRLRTASTGLALPARRIEVAA